MLGLAQSGLPRLRVASLQEPSHRELAVQARAHAEALLDPRGSLDRRRRRAPPRARCRLAAAHLGGRGRRRRGRRWLTPAGSSPGRARGIRLAGPGEGTRPMGDRVKQTLFAILEPDLRGRRVPRPLRGERRGGDRGAVARGASATFVERDGGGHQGDRRKPRPGAPRRAGRTPRERGGGPLARRRRAARPKVRGTSRSPTRRTTDPSSSSRRSTALGPLLAPGGRVVAKHASQAPPPARIGLLASERERRFGETTLTFYRRVEDR